MRETKTYEIHVDTSLASSMVIPLGDRIVGEIVVPSAATGLISLTWYVADDSTGDFLAAHDEDGNALVQSVLAGGAFPLPVDLAGAAAVKAVGNVGAEILVTVKA